MSTASSLTEPEGRTLTGVTLEWKHTRRLNPFPGRYSPLFKNYDALEGISWRCPSCATEEAVELRVSNPQRYWFQCGSCKWQERFNHAVANELIASLGVALPK